MLVLQRLRAVFPDIVMDHRQLNHQYGPWYQLAGSYGITHPASGVFFFSSLCNCPMWSAFFSCGSIAPASPPLVGPDDSFF